MGLLAEILHRSGFTLDPQELELEQRGPVWIGPTSQLVSAARYAPYNEQLLRQEERVEHVHPYVTACIHAICRNISSIPLKIYHKGVHESDSYLQRLLDQPNPDTCGSEYVYGVAANLLSAGNSFTEIRVAKRQVAEIWIVYPASGVKIVARKNPKVGDSIVDHYLYSPVLQMGSSSSNIRLDQEQIIHFKMFDSINSYYGLSPIEAAMEDLAVDMQARTWAEMFFRNDATPRGVIEREGNIYYSPAAVEAFENRWAEAHRGLRNAFRIAVLERGMKYKQISVPPGDIQFIEGRQFTEKMIRSLFGVPEVLLGEQKGTTGLETAVMVFFENVIIPLGLQIAGTLNRSLIWPFYGTDYEVKFDFISSPAMLPVVKEKMMIHQMMLQNAVPLPMIWQMLWGIEPPYKDKSLNDKAFVSAQLYELGMPNRSVSGDQGKPQNKKPPEDAESKVLNTLE